MLLIGAIQTFTLLIWSSLVWEIIRDSRIRMMLSATYSPSRSKTALWRVVGSSCWRSARQRPPPPAAATGWCGSTRSWRGHCLSPSNRKWWGRSSELNWPSDTEGEKPRVQHPPAIKICVLIGIHRISSLLYFCARPVASILWVEVIATGKDTNWVLCRFKWRRERHLSYSTTRPFAISNHQFGILPQKPFLHSCQGNLVL